MGATKVRTGITDNVVATTLFMFVLVRPLVNTLSSGVNHHASVLYFNSLTTVFAIPVLSTLRGISSPCTTFNLIVYTLLVIDFCASVDKVLGTRVFPTRIHTLNINLSCTITGTVFNNSTRCMTLSLGSVKVRATFF